jgi:hypothetical protein
LIGTSETVDKSLNNFGCGCPASGFAGGGLSSAAHPAAKIATAKSAALKN